MSEYYNRQWRLPNNENKNKQSNYSMDFDGSSSINCGPATAYNEFSLSVWIKKDSSAPNYAGIFGTRNGSAQAFPYLLSLDNSNKIRLIADGLFNILSDNAINDNVWYHVVGTGDGSDLKMYVNGQLQTATTAYSTPLITTTNDLMIGAQHNTDTGNVWVGQIDGVAIFDYALSASQVTTLYGSSSTGIGNPMSLSPKPVFYAPLGDQDSFNGSNYLVPNSSLKDYVFDTNGNYAKYFNLPKSTVGSDDFTFSFWVKPEPYAGGGGDAGDTLLGNTNGAAGANQWNMWIYEPTGRLNLVWYNETNNAGNFMTTNFSFGAGTVNQEWTHVVLTRVGTTVTFYFNGVVDTATAGTLSSSSITLDDSSNATMRLPSPWGGALYNQDGFYSNLLWHNVGLSASEVATLYNNGSLIQTLSSIPQSSNVQGWWKLDASATYDSSTTTWSIPDDSTNSNTGTSSGMTQANLVQSDLSFTSGYSPYALDFDGTNDYIDCGSLSLDINSGTVSVWIKSTNTSAFQMIIGKTTGGAGNDQLQFRTETIGKVRVTLFYSGGATILDSTATVLDGNWHHVAFTYNSSGMNIYIDGSASGSNTTNVTPLSTSTESFMIGARKISSPNSFFNGSISNCSVWNAALTSAQVTELYAEGVPSNLNNHSAYSNLVSWWQLGSNSSFNTNWTVLDEKGSNNGTSANMTEDDIVDGVGSYANGLSSGMGGDEVVGSAFGSSANALSISMDISSRTTDVPS